MSVKGDDRSAHFSAKPFTKRSKLVCGIWIQCVLIPEISTVHASTPSSKLAYTKCLSDGNFIFAISASTFCQELSVAGMAPAETAPGISDRVLYHSHSLQASSARLCSILT